MRKRVDPLYQPPVMQYVVCYAIWICLAVASVYLILQIRSNLMTPIVLLPIDPRTLIVINNATTVVFGFFALASILVMEHSLRTGVASKVFWPRLARIIVILAVVLGASYVVQIASVALMTSKGG